MPEAIRPDQITQKSYRPVLSETVKLVMWHTERKVRKSREEKDQQFFRALSVVLQQGLWQDGDRFAGRQVDGVFATAIDAGREFSDCAKDTAQDSCNGVWEPDPEMWRCARTERGKPYFIHHPEVQFSLSDSEDLTAAAFAPEPAGLDIQLHRRHGIRRTEEEENARLSRMAQRFYHPEERDYVLNSRDGIRQRFYRIWTAKEAYVKYTGQGIDGQFTKLSVMPEAPEDMPAPMADAAWIAQESCWEAQNCHFWYIEPEEGLSVCLCTESRLPVSVIYL